MFGKKHPALAEMDISGCTQLLAGSREFLRMWAEPNGPATCLIDTQPVGADPFAFGIALADCVRHAAKAYSHATAIAEAEAEKRIWAGLDAERASPTDTVSDLSNKGTPN
jgi:uncharacterized protein DUF5076